MKVQYQQQGSFCASVSTVQYSMLAAVFPLTTGKQSVTSDDGKRVNNDAGSRDAKERQGDTISANVLRQCVKMKIHQPHHHISHRARTFSIDCACAVLYHP